MKPRCCFIVAVMALWFCAFGCAGSHQASEAGTFRVMTYNIHHGEGMDGKLDLARIAALIKSAQADIVALQEVDKRVERTARRDLPVELAALTGMTCVFSNNYNYQGGEYGNAVLTRFPVKHVTNHLYRMLKAHEQRGLLQVTLSVHGQDICIWNTHLDAGHDDAERWASLAELTALAAACDQQPFLLCGDFNDVPTSRVYEKLTGQFVDSWMCVGKGDGSTVPVTKPMRRIDYLWISKNRMLTPKSARLIQSEASDHLPVVAEFEIGPRQTRGSQP